MGNKGSGKTSVLNVLFPGSPVELLRQGVAKIHFSLACTRDAKRQRQLVEGGASLMPGGTAVYDKSRPDRKMTKKKVFRKAEEISVKSYYVELDCPIYNLTRDNTIVVTDTPGIDTCDNEDRCMQYVQKKWVEFDCVVLVIDVSYSMNQAAMFFLLSFVQVQKDDVKDIPVMILCNKADHPHDDAVAGLIRTMQANVERAFSVDDRKIALEKMINGSLLPKAGRANPCFIPVSAKMANLYTELRKAPCDVNGQVYNVGGMEEEKMEKAKAHEFNAETAMGRSGNDRNDYSYSLQNKVTPEENSDLIFGIVNNPKEYQRRTDRSNFQTAVFVLNRFVGGDYQPWVKMGNELEETMSLLSKGLGIVENLNLVYDKNKELGLPTSHIQNTFWSAYHLLKKQAFDRLGKDVTAVCKLHSPMWELVHYAHSMLERGNMSSTTKDKELGIVIDEMKDMIRLQFHLLRKKEAGWAPIDPCLLDSSYCPGMWEWRESGWYNTKTNATFPTTRDLHPANQWADFWKWNESKKLWTNQYSMDEKRVSKDTNPATLSYNWATLSPYDWSAILSAMFTCEGEKVFYENFSKELSEKNYLCQHGRFVQPEYCYQCKRSTCQCQKIGSRYEEYLEGSYLDGIFVPVDQLKYNLVRHIQVHEELSDPDHWGHLGWMFVEFMQSRDGMNKSMSSCRQHD